MLENFKTKILIILFAATLIIPAFLMAYQPKDGEGGTGLAQDLWVEIHASEVPVQKAIAYARDFPAGFRDASMGQAVTGPIKVEGG